MSKFEFTHLDKVFFKEAGLTKGDLVEYYQTVAKTMLPYLKNRPESLLRQPDGYNGISFFQKDMGDKLPAWVKTKKIHSDSTGEDINYLVCNDQDSLLYMVQLGCIEINPWSSTLGHPGKPDWIVIDLDPEGVDFESVVEVALCVKMVCDELKIPAHPKTSGKTGIHIYIPMQAKYSYDQGRDLAHLLVTLVNQRTPELTSIERSLKKRPHKIYLDFLQNSQGQTLAAPYSARPTKFASVSTPLHWDEVNKRLDPMRFTIKTTPKRLAKVGDLWRPVLGKGIELKKMISKIENIIEK